MCTASRIQQPPYNFLKNFVQVTLFHTEWKNEYLQLVRSEIMKIHIHHQWYKRKVELMLGLF